MANRNVINRSAGSMDVLRSRVARLFSSVKMSRDPRQLALPMTAMGDDSVSLPTDTLSGFIDFLAASVPSGEVYIFGGVLRDLALFGRRGFNSDIDIVIEGDWAGFVTYLERLGARKNKFGGYRLAAGDWPIDVWNAEDTWAIKQGLVLYEGIHSLTKTTVLNWDAILMNWRSKRFICDAGYLEALKCRALDVVLEENPNPLGMAVRVFRHLSSKDARSISRSAVVYLERCTSLYAFEELRDAELSSYGNSIIEPVAYRFFALSRFNERGTVDERFSAATKALGARGDGTSWRQLKLSLQGTVTL